MKIKLFCYGEKYFEYTLFMVKYGGGSIMLKECLPLVGTGS